MATVRMRWLLLLLGAVTLGCGGAVKIGTDASADASADAIAVDTAADATGDASGADAAADTGGSCNPGAIAFPQGGTLAPGTLCDELYACADDAAGAARIEAASPRFSCAPGSEPGSACDAYTCAFRDPGGPSTLDASEIADICAITVLTPPPALRCTVFVNAPR
jgi:hypothetical protein